MKFYMRQTKIIATVGPASDTDDTLDALIAAGTDIVRLNFSHGTHETHAATFARVRRAATRAGRAVAILQMRQDAFDHSRIFDARNHLHLPATGLTGFYLNLEHPLKALRPCHRRVAR